MPKARVLKGGWTWKGVPMEVGAVIDAPSTEWVRNRMADGGLVELIELVPVVQEIEVAVAEPAETAMVETKPVSSRLLGSRRRGNQRSI